ncbi:MAG TPA: hypothetical protein VIM73_21570, partial [Polyangiaceae bacterium]
MPMSFDFTSAAAGAMGQQLRTSLNPFLTQMNDILRRNNSVLHRIGHGVMTMVLAGLSAIGAPPADTAPVAVVNLGFLELMAGGSFAFLVLIFLKLDEISRRIARLNVRMGDIHNNLQAMATAIANLSGQLERIIGLLRLQVDLLGQILAQLRLGLRVTGTLAVSGLVTVLVVVTGPGPGGGGGGLPLPSWEDILKLLALAAIIAAFVAVLGLALRTFTATGIVAMVVLSFFIAALKDFVDVLSKLDWEGVFRVGL